MCPVGANPPYFNRQAVVQLAGYWLPCYGNAAKAVPIIAGNGPFVAAGRLIVAVALGYIDVCLPQGYGPY